ncbi:MAG: tRNA 2-thiouridine(34) synthase MnmA [Clostridiales bacterium]|nr:tRNA 2-thiouridine(34) synthase MnmA [Clostridiales bacterium]
MALLMEESALVAMSGGVDSSVAAALMLRRGCRCQGVTMRLYNNDTVGQSEFHTCCSERDVDDASQVAFQLDIPYSVVDYTVDFRAQIIDKFIRIYEAGGTPNPCIDCNRYMKFDKLLRYADEQGLSWVVTGHYARICRDEEKGRWLLKKAADESKDQSYVLYMLTQEQLSRIRFPLGEMTKEQTRAVAQELGFCNAAKHDSQDICFVPDGDYAAFMERYTGKRYPEGDFLDLSGQVVGRHRGAVRYTLGQRKGLGLAMGEPVYVCRKDMAANTVSVGPNEALYARTVLVGELNWIAIPALTAPMRVKAKLRYRQREQWATLSPEGEELVRLTFDQPQRAATVGQAAVFYDGDTVVGGGTIAAVPSEGENGGVLPSC